MLRLVLSRILNPLNNQRGSATALILLFDKIGTGGDSHPGDNLLLETGDNLLNENGTDAILLE